MVVNIYRVTGGGDPRRVKVKEFIEYGVHVYELTKEVNSVLYVTKDGKSSILNKKKDVETANTLFVSSLKEAFDEVFRKIHTAIDDVNDTVREILLWRPDNPDVELLYRVKFRKERFSLAGFLVTGRTKNAVKIDARGRKYVYRQHLAGLGQPHDPLIPFEDWMDTDLRRLKDSVLTYATARMDYLYERLDQLERQYDELKRKGFK
jgi:hypothetical protein